MTTGTYISGGGHVGLILVLLFGGWLGDTAPEPPDVADVSILTEEEFAALSAPNSQPAPVFDVPTPATPAVEDSVAPAPRPQDRPVTAQTPEPAAPEVPDVVPDQPDAPQPPDPDVADEVPQLTQPTPPQPDIPIIAPVDDTPTPQDAPRVAPIPVPEAPLRPEIAETATPRVSPDANTPEVAEEQPEAAPEAATTEIVTEAETPSSAAPTRSVRPPSRPTRPAVVATETPTETPTETLAPDTPVTDPAADAIAAAVAAAVAEPTPAPAPATPSVPTGPPLTRGQKDGLRVAVQQCWNVGSLSTEALQVTVVVGVSMGRDGKPDTGSIRMLDYFDGSDSAARQAFEAARRAIIRCGASGYDLPIEKYEQWRDIEMTFNPERMRIK